MCFKVEFEKPIAVFYQHPWFLQNAKFHVKQEDFQFGTKIAFFGHFWDSVLKSYCHILIEHPRRCRITKFHPKQDNFKLGTKNALFGFF